MTYLWEYIMELCTEYEINAKGIEISIENNKVNVADKFTLSIGDRVFLFGYAGTYIETKLLAIEESNDDWTIKFDYDIVETVPKTNNKLHTFWVLIGKIN